jgi:hypothetical protein
VTNWRPSHKPFPVVALSRRDSTQQNPDLTEFVKEWTRTTLGLLPCHVCQFPKLVPLPRLGLEKSTGFEPATNRRNADRSTVELTFRLVRDTGLEPVSTELLGCSASELIMQ